MMLHAGDLNQDERWANEHIGAKGHLHVPVASSLDRAPKREGWEPFFVVINLERTPQKHHIYRRT